MNSLALLLILASRVAVTPGLTVIPLGGPQRTVDVWIRNLEEADLLDVHLQAQVKDVVVTISPQGLPVVRPGERVTFTLDLRRTAQTPRSRFPLLLKFSSRGEEDLMLIKLMVDGARTSTTTGDGWIEVGVVKIASRNPTHRTLVLALLSLIPLAGLLALGWWLKRRARAKPAGQPPH
jgi:hypothetical protein